MVKSESIELDLIFHAFSDATRRAILRGIAKKDKTVGQIAEPFRMSLAAVSKHLKVLERARLIERRKVGSFQIVSLKPETFKTADQWISFYEQFWGDRLDALKVLLEKK